MKECGGSSGSVVTTTSDFPGEDALGSVSRSELGPFLGDGSMLLPVPGSPDQQVSDSGDHETSESRERQTHPLYQSTACCRELIDVRKGNDSTLHIDCRFLSV